MVGLRTTLVDLRLGGTGDGACLHAQPSPAESVPVSSAGSLVLLVLFLALCCVFHLFLLYSLPVYCSDFIEIFVG
jgi:hypothetical protein